MQYIKFSVPVLSVMKILSLILLISIFHSCKDRIPDQKEPLVARTPLDIAIIADTVTYDVIVKNPEQEDLLTEEFLRNLNITALVDIIFNAIYLEELVPYDYFSNRPLSVREIRELEEDPEFNRENIGKIQFSEEWYFDEENLRMKKRVNSLLLGYEAFDTNNNLRGYKPAFLVKLN